MPQLSTVIDKFLRRAPLSLSERSDILSDLGALTDDPRHINPGTITSWVASGDSITSAALPNPTFGNNYSGGSWAYWADIITGRSFGRRNASANIAFAASGHNSNDFLVTHIPAILALDPRPSHVVAQYGTNDAGTWPVTTYITKMRTAAQTLRAAGIEPIYLTTPQASPINSIAAIGGSTRASRVAIQNEALYDLCREERILLIDNRGLDNPIAPGEGFRGMFSEGSLFGLHPHPPWHVWVGENVARTLSRWTSGSDILAQFQAANSETRFESNTPSPTAGTNLTLTTSVIARGDSVGGNILQIIVANNGTKQIGSGDTGISFAPAMGRMLGEFDVAIHTENGYTGLGGLPAIAVVPVVGSSRKLILVKPVRPVLTFTSTVQEVINAINTHPEASQLCVASATGTPGTLALPAVSANVSTIPVSNFSTYEPGSSPSSENALSDTDEVRAICECWVPNGALPPYLRLNGRASYGSGTFGLMVGGQPISILTPVGMPRRRLVIVTPWVTVGAYRRLQAQVFFGGAEGYYQFGRTMVQRRPA